MWSRGYTVVSRRLLASAWSLGAGHSRHRPSPARRPVRTEACWDLSSRCKPRQHRSNSRDRAYHPDSLRGFGLMASGPLATLTILTHGRASVGPQLVASAEAGDRMHTLETQNASRPELGEDMEGSV